jgi:NhaP-type Na+/H+ or K+/H+ antiporter
MGWGLLITGIINLNIARGLNVLIVSAIANTSRTKNKISWKVQMVTWLSGLRGAMAYALALKAAVTLPLGPVILIFTLLYSFLTILIVGSILNPVLAKCDVKRKTLSPEALAAIELEDEGRQGCCVRFKRTLAEFDHEHFSPLFIKDPLVNAQDPKETEL